MIVLCKTQRNPDTTVITIVIPDLRIVKPLFLLLVLFCTRLKSFPYTPFKMFYLDSFKPYSLWFTHEHL